MDSVVNIRKVRGSPIKRRQVKKNISPVQVAAFTAPWLAQRWYHLIYTEAQRSFTAPAVSLD
jgi:hypothetical protein